MDIDKLHLIYEDTLNIEINNNKCCCIDNNFIPDKDNYYLVCDICHLGVDTTKDICMSYEDKQSLQYVPRRYYKRSAYLRTKINNIIKSKKPILPDEHIKKIKKKFKIITMTVLSKYMKKHKLKKYDPVKSIFLIKNIKPINMCSFDFDKLICDFNKKERIYRNNNYNRFNYNFVLLKIFEEWNRPDISICFKLLQDDDIYIKHQQVYDTIFN